MNHVVIECAFNGLTSKVLVTNGLLYPLAKSIDRRPRKPGREKRTDF